MIEAGFTTLVFADDFETLDSIDLTGRGDPAKQWFTDRPFGWGRTPAEDLYVTDGILTVSQTTSSPNYGIGTASAAGKAGRGWRYGYFEAKISFDPKKSSESPGWPSFWGVSAEQVKGADLARTAEIDFFEAYHEADEPFQDVYTGTVHDALISPSYVDRASYGNNMVVLAGVDWTDFHVYGCLWQKGRITWYMDGNPMITQTYSRDSPPDPNPSRLATGAYSPLDTDSGGQSVVLGSGVGFPMRVDWVRVWQ